MAGRGKKKQISEEDMAKAEQLALDNCQNATIEGLMGWPNAFISKRDDIAKRIRQKRQAHKAEIRANQRRMAKTNPVMAIWLGKNSLGQTDKQDMRHGVTSEAATLLGLLDGKSAGRLPSDGKAALPGEPNR